MNNQTPSDSLRYLLAYYQPGLTFQTKDEGWKGETQVRCILPFKERYAGKEFNPVFLVYLSRPYKCGMLWCYLRTVPHISLPLWRADYL